MSNGGKVVDLVAYRELIRLFGLSADEAGLVDISLALEYGLLSGAPSIEARNQKGQVDRRTLARDCVD